MTTSKKLLEKLGLLTIDGYVFDGELGGGSGLSGVYRKGTNRVVFKFLIAPRNTIEFERFKLEYSVLDKNMINWRGKRHSNPSSNYLAGNVESYPLPIISHSIKHECEGMVSYFGYEYEEGILLSEFIKKELSISEKIKLLFRVASGLSYFHQAGYSHRDLHPENILLLKNFDMPPEENIDNNPKVKILDLGNCHVLPNCGENSYGIYREESSKAVFEDNNRRLLSSFKSMPPDFLTEGEGIKNYDSWAFGVFAYKLYFNTLPTEANSIQEVITLLRNGQFSDDFKFNLNTLDVGNRLVLKHLLSPKGGDRPTTDTIVRLFHWMVNESENFKDEEFIKRVIHADGADPDFDFVRDYY